MILCVREREREMGEFGKERKEKRERACDRERGEGLDRDRPLVLETNSVRSFTIHITQTHTYTEKG